jgi:hypothetical protein
LLAISDLKSDARKGVGVGVPLPLPINNVYLNLKVDVLLCKNSAYKKYSAIAL